MKEGKPRGMKGHAPQALDQLGRERVAPLLGAIGGVAHQGMTKRCEVNADLMRAASLEQALEVGESGKALEDVEVGDGPLAGACPGHGHADSRAGIAGDWRIDHALVTPDHAVRETQIAARHRPPLKLRRERIVRLTALGEHDQPGRALVEAVDDAGPARTTDPWARQR